MTPTKAAPTETKKEVEKTTKETQEAVQAGAEKATHAIDEIFGKLKAHFETKKVDDWQKNWLAVPANRKKYEKFADAPEVVGEEALAITNDIIDFIQGQEAGQSHLLKRMKGKFQAFFKHPVQAAPKEEKKEAPAVAEKTEKPKNGNGKAKKAEAKPAKK